MKRIFCKKIYNTTVTTLTSPFKSLFSAHLGSNGLRRLVSVAATAVEEPTWYTAHAQLSVISPGTSEASTLDTMFLSGSGALGVPYSVVIGRPLERAFLI